MSDYATHAKTYSNPPAVCVELCRDPLDTKKGIGAECIGIDGYEKI